MNMKKFSALLLALSMVLSLAACGGKSTDQPSDDSQSGSEAAASDLHLGYDLNTGENYYGPIPRLGGLADLFRRCQPSW